MCNIEGVSEKNIQFSIIILNCGKSKQSTATTLQWPKNETFQGVRRFLNGIIPWSGVKVMVL